jgi:hypothetical protein
VTIQSMAESLAARDEGIASSVAHANDDAPGWSQRAYDAVIDSPYIRRFREFTMERASLWLYADGLDVPAEKRAWGAVTQRLLRDGIIEPVGYAKAASSHGSPKRTYRLRRPS